jgi:hypothetical protein
MTKLLPAFAYDESTSVIEDVPGATGALALPDGTTAQRPSTPANGMVRYNTVTQEFEVYESAQWVHMIGAQTHPTVVWLHDDFFGFFSGTALLSDNTWVVGTIGPGSGPTGATVLATHPNYGVKRWSTTTNSGDGYVLYPMTAGANMGNFSLHVPWELQWVFRIGLTTSFIRFRIGLTPTPAPGFPFVAVPTDGIFLRYDTSAGFADERWMFECRASSAFTDEDSTVTANASFHRIRIRSVTAGSVIFNLDNLGDVTINQHVPSAALMPAAHCVTDTNAARYADYDLCTFRLRGVSR